VHACAANVLEYGDVPNDDAQVTDCDDGRRLRARSRLCCLICTDPEESPECVGGIASHRRRWQQGPRSDSGRSPRRKPSTRSLNGSSTPLALPAPPIVIRPQEGLGTPSRALRPHGRPPARGASAVTGRGLPTNHTITTG
jgi:hypothetical protein